MNEVDSNGAVMSCFVFYVFSACFPGMISPKTVAIGAVMECWQQTTTTEVETTTLSLVFIDPLTCIWVRPGVDVDLPSASALCK